MDTSNLNLAQTLEGMPLTFNLEAAADDLIVLPLTGSGLKGSPRV